MTRLRSAIFPLSLFATSLLPLACGGGSSDTPPAVCGELESYTPTSASQVTLADVYPILSSSVAASGGCAQAGACHGDPALPIDALGLKKLQFVFTPEDQAMAKAQLLMASVNASGMQRVSPGSVKNSFLSYKISGKDGLSCIKSMCQGGASVGSPPCGDPMPNIGTLSAADRTKILDWIAGGAVD